MAWVSKKVLWVLGKKLCGEKIQEGTGKVRATVISIQSGVEDGGAEWTNWGGFGFLEFKFEGDD